MKKFLILILICFVQNTFSQSTKPTAKTKASATKNTEPVIVKVKITDDYDSNLVVDEPSPANKVSNNNENAIYNTAGIEVKPEFPGGQQILDSFIKQNYKTPKEGLKGKVYATFIVEKDGSLSDIKILRDLGYGTGQEAIRVLKLSPKWSPGKQNNKTVRVLYSIPIILN